VRTMPQCGLSLHSIRFSIFRLVFDAVCLRLSVGLLVVDLAGRRFLGRGSQGLVGASCGRVRCGRQRLKVRRGNSHSSKAPG
jgi:hypothetical protein